MYKIELKSTIAPTLSSRDVVDVVENLVNNSDQKRVVIDFSDVAFVSRSAADQLLKLKRQHSKWFSSKRVSFQNISPDVEQILVLVRKQQSSKRRQSNQMESVNIQELV